MSFVDETVNTAKEWFDVASKKTAETVTVQKLRIAVSRKKSELCREYEMLGRFYFGNKQGDIDDELLAQQEETVALVLEELKQRVEAYESAKNMKTCPECGQKNPAGSAFCNHCGKSLAKD